MPKCHAHRACNQLLMIDISQGLIDQSAGIVSLILEIQIRIYKLDMLSPLSMNQLRAIND
jgi:hypothetical protein